jgi:two-component system CheB/CheR fusion protein
MTNVPLDPTFTALLDFLKRARGIDFTGYKRPSLERRVRRRLDAVGCAGFGDYLDHLEVHPEEYEALLDSLLINVTEFFRDPPTWHYVRDVALPQLLGVRSDTGPIRVWSAGCASGQEAYSIAILLAELLGKDGYRTRVKIYATDIDEDALATARQAQYTPQEMESVPLELRERYFERANGGSSFRTDLRRGVVFGRNNLVQDAPISRLDLLFCRNTLMYLNAETQGRVLRHFHFALREHGVMVLGSAEMIMAHRDMFAAMDLKMRVFTRRERRVASRGRPAGRIDGQEVDLPLSEDERMLRDIALEMGPVPQLIVSRAGVLTFANVSARALLGIGTADLGRPFAELAVSDTPADLRLPVDEALGEGHRVAVGEVRFVPDRGEERRLDVSVSPLRAEGTTAIGVSIQFDDVTRDLALRRAVEGQRVELQHAYEQLQSTVDELETTNEELQSANEELQTTNEELQSTNEELETMNDELESTNAELNASNDALQERTAELDELNGFLEGILSGLHLAVVVVDNDLHVRVWNHRAEDLWGVRKEEALEHELLSPDMGLPTALLAPALRAVLGGDSLREDLELDGVDRRGRAIVCATSVVPLVCNTVSGTAIRGAILLMEDAVPGGVPLGADAR